MVAPSPIRFPLVLTSGVWGGMVNQWNKLLPSERVALRDTCRTQGHDYKVTDLGARFCVRCRKWSDD